jgi:hypothetical protein
MFANYLLIMLLVFVCFIEVLALREEVALRLLALLVLRFIINLRLAL